MQHVHQHTCACTNKYTEDLPMPGNQCSHSFIVCQSNRYTCCPFKIFYLFHFILFFSWTSYRLKMLSHFKDSAGFMSTVSDDYFKRITINTYESIFCRVLRQLNNRSIMSMSSTRFLSVSAVFQTIQGMLKWNFSQCVTFCFQSSCKYSSQG